MIRGVFSLPILPCPRSPTPALQRPAWGTLVPLVERFELHREAGRSSGPIWTRHTWTALRAHRRRVNRAGAVPLQPVWPSPRVAVLLDIPLGHLSGPRARRRHPDDLRLGCRAADACRRTPSGTAATAGAAACGGASRLAPPARSSVSTSRRPRGKDAGGDPRGPAAETATADWSPMSHAAWSRTTAASAFTAEGCAVLRTQQRPPAAVAVLPVGLFRAAGIRLASMPGSTPRSSTAAGAPAAAGAPSILA
jgi:hypothetical protein